MLSILRVIMYLVLIAIVAAAIYGLIYAVNNGLTDLTEKVSTVVNNASSWLEEKVDYVTGLIN